MCAQTQIVQKPSRVKRFPRLINERELLGSGNVGPARTLLNVDERRLWRLHTYGKNLIFSPFSNFPPIRTPLGDLFELARARIGLIRGLAKSFLPAK